MITLRTVLGTAIAGCPLFVLACASPAPSDPYAGADSSSDEGAADSPSAKSISGFTEVDLVSDRPGAATQDLNLLNPWGIAFNPAGPAWIANNHSGTSTVYDDAGTLKLTVTLPAAAGSTDPAAPTGQVFNGAPTDFAGDAFIFDGEDGRVYGWQPGTGVTVRADRSSTSASYKGLALAVGDDGTQRLYLTDFHNGKIDVVDASYQPLALDGDFSDPKIPAGYAPFNAQALEGKILVTYAMQDADKADDTKGAGHGFVDQFDTEGHFERRLITHGALNSPWALAIAPDGWGDLAGALLVGNFGNGRVHAYDIHAPNAYGGEKTVAEGTLSRGSAALVIDGLWALAVGPDGKLYFTAGQNGEANGLFGRLDQRGAY
jgi:uncharacterized protein (TIGR03118 family)